MVEQILKILNQLEVLNESLIEQIQVGAHTIGGSDERLMERIRSTRYTLGRLEEKLSFVKKLEDLDDAKVQEISLLAEKLMEGEHVRERFHCSEAFVLAAGSYLFDDISPMMRRVTSGLAGGVGGSHEEMCGALVGGVLCIGGLFGRARPTEDDQPSYRLSVFYREKFIETFGSARCMDLRNEGYGSSGHTPCGVLVARSIPVFFEAVRNREHLFEDYK